MFYGGIVVAINYIEIETSQLDKDYQKMQVDLSSVQNEISKLFEEMQQLDTMWDGPAKLTFRSQMLNDFETMNDICSNLLEFINDMKRASSEYKKCEKEVANLIATIRI